MSTCSCLFSPLLVPSGVWRLFHQCSGSLPDPRCSLWPYLSANDSAVSTHTDTHTHSQFGHWCIVIGCILLECREIIRKEGCFYHSQWKTGKAPLTLVSPLSQGGAGAAAARAVCLFPRGLCHVPAPHQCSGRTLWLLPAGSGSEITWVTAASQFNFLLLRFLKKWLIVLSLHHPVHRLRACRRLVVSSRIQLTVRISHNITSTWWWFALTPCWPLTSAPGALDCARFVPTKQNKNVSAATRLEIRCNYCSIYTYTLQRRISMFWSLCLIASVTQSLCLFWSTPNMPVPVWSKLFMFYFYNNIAR